MVFQSISSLSTALELDPTHTLMVMRRLNTLSNNNSDIRKACIGLTETQQIVIFKKISDNTDNTSDDVLRWITEIKQN